MPEMQEAFDKMCFLMAIKQGRWWHYMARMSRRWPWWTMVHCVTPTDVGGNCQVVPSNNGTSRQEAFAWNTSATLSPSGAPVHHWQVQVLALPETQIVRQRLWTIGWKGDPNSTLGRSHNRLNWPMDGQGQQQKGWI
jgi:hypothetical protein